MSPRAKTLSVLPQGQNQLSSLDHLPQTPSAMDSGLPVGISMVRACPCLSLREHRDNIHGLQSLWDNQEFSQAGFHLRWFVTAVVDIEADRENIRRSTLAGRLPRPKLM
jgi:hypothetical protein